MTMKNPGQVDTQTSNLFFLILSIALLLHFHFQHTTETAKLLECTKNFRITSIQKSNQGKIKVFKSKMVLTTRLEKSPKKRLLKSSKISHILIRVSKTDYERFNRNSFSIHSWSWYYRGCWHQTCPPIVTHTDV